MKPGSPPAEHRDVDVGDGLRLHVAIAGAGPPLVLLHGFTGSGETWASLAARLGSQVTTVAVDLPGHGRSSAPDDPGRYALDRFAADLCRLLDVLRIERAAVLGYSLGGRAALRFSLAHPARLAGLVLESASPGIADEAERGARLAADGELADLIEREGVAAFTDRWERLPLWASQDRLPPDARAALRAQRLGNRPSGLANSLRGASAAALPAVTARLGELAAPVLVVAGRLDTKYEAIAQQMAAAMPDARAVVLDDAGHAVHLEQPEAFAELVSGFAARMPQAGGQWA